MPFELTTSMEIARDLGLDYWGEHPDHPVSDWQNEVANDEVRCSYWEWVEGRIESLEDCELSCSDPHGTLADFKDFSASQLGL